MTRLIARSLLALGVSAGLATVSLAQSADEYTLAPPISAISSPSEMARLVFPDMGVIREVKVKDGDIVKQGQALTQMDDDVELKTLEQLKLEAESTSRVEAAEAELKVNTSVFERISSSKTGYSVKEREEAELRMIGAQKQLQVARDEHAISQVKYQGYQKKVEKMSLTAPFDGIVQRVVLRAGEGADPRSEQGALILVKNDPLWVEIKGLSTKTVSKLKLGDVVQVRYEDDGKNASWESGKIIYISPVADASSKSQMIRVELPNPTGRASGLHLEVNLSTVGLGTATAKQ